MNHAHIELTIDLRVGQHFAVDISAFSRVAVQASNPLGRTWESAVIGVEKSITGAMEDATAFGTPVAISGVGLTDLEDDEVEPSRFLHFEVTTPESASGEIKLHLYATDIGA